jgi:hypothetical protein
MTPRLIPIPSLLLLAACTGLPPEELLALLPAPTTYTPLRDALRVDAPPSARYLRAEARNTGPMPHGHKAAGQPSWIYISEISAL